MDDPEFAKMGMWLGTIAALLVFIGSWIYCTAEYGFLFGFGLGWLPSAILAAIVFPIMRYLWPFVVLAGAGLIWLYLRK